MTIGTVRWFDVRKGYGFLKPDDGGVDVLIDVCAVERAGMAGLYQGQRLSFDVVYDKRIGKSCADNLGASGLQGSEPRLLLPRPELSGLFGPGYVYSEAAPVAYNNGDSVAYCEQTFRSYDPASGSYLGYDGFRHACP